MDPGIESRMILQRSRGNGGEYYYFFCAEKTRGGCDSHYLELDAIEDEVVDVYGAMTFDPDLSDVIRFKVNDCLKEQAAAETYLRSHFEAELEKIDKQEDNLYNFVAEGSVVSEKARQRLADIQMRRESVLARLRNVQVDLNTGVRLIEGALTLLVDPKGLYSGMEDAQRRKMNRAVFEKLYVEERKVTAVVLKPPFDELIEASLDPVAESFRTRSQFGPFVAHCEVPIDGPEVNLRALLLDLGSNKPLMVGLPGFEPGTSASRTQRANQAAPQPVRLPREAGLPP
jgi:hypothetical protein